MNIVRFDPFRELDAFFGPRPQARASAPVAAPATVSESARAYRIELELPAVDRDDVEVSVKDGVLTIAGERKHSSDEEWKVLRTERAGGAGFSRSFRLPKDAREDAIEASAANGVLTVLIGKAEAAGPRRIEIAAA